ncbi:MAG TPA: Asp-tRNA(Asn)/Glu-tRNA(Gln) amidotransferase subunit GatA [Candidatus Paceibacterota bacterium]
MDVRNLTIKKIQEGLLNKTFSALELTETFLDRIEKEDPNIGAYLSVNAKSAVAQAESVDIAIAKDEPLSAVAGIPLGIKDNLLIEGWKTTAASKMLAHYRSAYDATVIRKLKTAGSIFLGKTNMDEFAMGSSTENSAFQKTRNPHDLQRVPGGSSGGSAAAVAADLAVAALGSDTGGSIRQPASFCGVVGLKPTYGAVSRYGLIAMASSLDQIGPITKTVEDAAILFNAIAGQDAADATSAATNYGETLLQPKLETVRALTIGIPEEYFVSNLDSEIGLALQQVIKDLEGLGIKTKKVSLPNTKHALSCYYIIMPAEVSSNLERLEGIRYAEIDGVHRDKESLVELYKQNRSRGFGAEAKRRIMLGTFVLSSGYYDAYYARAQKVRSLIKQDFDEAFKEVDVLLTPVAPTRAFAIGEKTNDPLQMYLSDIFTIPVNLAGVPAISIPTRPIKGLPIGFQLIGRHWREEDILGIGQYYEKIHI